MKLIKIPKNKFTISNWAGGTTKELFIFPENSNYAERNFDFRISSAVIELEQSDFTKLDGFNRNLMVLDGEIIIKHEGHYSKHLKQFEIDNFEGNWNTSSCGKCTDFNLMTSNKYYGELDFLSINKNDILNLNFDKSLYMRFLYLYNGDLKIEQNKSHLNCSAGDLIQISEVDDNQIQLITNSRAEVIIANICLS